jgi:hypothetical protein
MSSSTSTLPEQVQTILQQISSSQDELELAWEQDQATNEQVVEQSLQRKFASSVEKPDLTNEGLHALRFATLMLTSIPFLLLFHLGIIAFLVAFLAIVFAPVGIITHRQELQRKRKYERAISYLESTYFFANKRYSLQRLKSLKYVAKAQTVGASTYIDIVQEKEIACFTCNIEVEQPEHHNDRKAVTLMGVKLADAPTPTLPKIPQESSVHKGSRHIGRFLLSKENPAAAVELNDTVLAQLERINKSIAEKIVLHDRRLRLLKQAEDIRQDILAAREKVLQQFDGPDGAIGFNEQDLAVINGALRDEIADQITYRKQQEAS